MYTNKLLEIFSYLEVWFFTMLVWARELRGPFYVYCSSCQLLHLYKLIDEPITLYI